MVAVFLKAEVKSPPWRCIGWFLIRRNVLRFFNRLARFTTLISPSDYKALPYQRARRTIRTHRPAEQASHPVVAVVLVENGFLDGGNRSMVLANDVDGTLMESALYLFLGLAALIAGVILYRRRKIREPVDDTYCLWVPPAGGNLADRGTYLLYGRRPTD